jgi:membrane protein implicated in regulation of membrane protease activity
MNDYWIWWILATLLVGAEMVTGTFYLLAVGIAFAFGGLSAWVGASMPLQLLTAGVLAVVGTMLAHRWRMRRGQASQQPDLDIGQSVRVETWNADGTARVDYRGTQWNGEVESPHTPRRHTMYIVATRGSTLVLGAERR